MSGLTTQTGMAVAAARKVAEKVTIGAGSSSGRISAMADGDGPAGSAQSCATAPHGRRSHETAK